MIVAQREALGHVLLDAAEVPQDALAHRLERFEAVAGTRGMAADARAGAMVDGNEHPGPAVSEADSLGHVGAPHEIHGGGGDGGGMGTRLVRESGVEGKRVELWGC